MHTDERLRLALDSAELHQVLESGQLTLDGAPVAVTPTALDVAQRQVTVERVDPRRDRPPATVVWWRAIRAISLTATATPAIATLLYGSLRGWSMRPLVAGLAILGALLLQIAVNLINDVEDHLRLIDLPGGPGGAGIIQRGWLSARQVRRAALLSLGLGVLAGLPALFAAPVPILIIGALGTFGAFGYSGRPFGLKYRALGDLAVLALCGPGMTLGMSYAAFGQSTPGIWLLGGYFGLLAVGILHANNLEDVELDASRNAQTVAQLLGRGGSRAYFVALYVVALGLPLVGVLLGELRWPVAVAPLVGLPLVVPLQRAVLGHAPAGPLPTRVRAAQAHLALGILVIVALLVSRWL